MAGKVKTWVWVVLGIFAFGILLLVGGAAASVYYFRKHIDTRKATATEAAAEFDRIRARFATQKPLIELDGDGDIVRTHTDRPTPADARAPEKLHVLVYDLDDGGMVKLTIPFWLLRLKSGNTKVDFGGGNMNLDDLKLTVEDLERLGPTLVVDQRNRGGDRVLVWTE